METIGRLLTKCADRPGIVAAVSGFFHAHGANITVLDQHSTDPEGGTFFMRVEFQTPHLDLSRPALEKAFRGVVAERFEMEWQLTYAADRKRTVVFCSKYDHALLELLWLWKNGALYTDIAAVISNHDDLRGAVESFGVPYHHVPVTKETKADAEAQALEIIDDAELVVLARYMQILTPGFVDRFPQRIINIHHSFLPAFVGARPYHQAYDRGVKVIGATAHYVTADLDEGPIIAQGVESVSHRHGVKDLVALGRGLERKVLAGAVKAHLEDRIIVDANKTVVF